MSKIEVKSTYPLMGLEPEVTVDYYSISKYEDIGIAAKTSIEIGEYKTISPIPYDVLEVYLKDVISNWNQKQKK